MGKTWYRMGMDSLSNGEQPIAVPIDVDSMTAETRLKLGELIRERRERLGITQAELATAAGVDRKTLGTIENSKRAGQPDKLRSILEALNVPQVSDADRLYCDSTRSFVASTAPIFDQLPSHLKSEAQHDIVVLLAGKLARARGESSRDHWDTDTGTQKNPASKPEWPAHGVL